MENAYLGSIFMWPGLRIPQGWRICNGDLLNISDNEALFVVIGTTYGGDGMNNFALPNLKGRFAVGTQTSNQLGMINGTATATATTTARLTTDNLPEHDHPATLALNNLSATTTIKADTGTTGGLPLATEQAILASTSGGPDGAAIYLPESIVPTELVKLGGVSTAVSPAISVGNNTTAYTSVSANSSFPLAPPTLTINYIICTSGIFPPRS